MAQQASLARADASAPVHLTYDPGAQLGCTLCQPDGRETPAAARCRLCSLVLCSDHLSRALRPPRTDAESGCRHLFVAVGWLARVAERRIA
jgi:hypothetical protein